MKRCKYFSYLWFDIIRYYIYVCIFIYLKHFFGNSRAYLQCNQSLRRKFFIMYNGLFIMNNLKIREWGRKSFILICSYCVYAVALLLEHVNYFLLKMSTSQSVVSIHVLYFRWRANAIVLSR